MEPAGTFTGNSGNVFYLSALRSVPLMQFQLKTGNPNPVSMGLSTVRKLPVGIALHAIAVWCGPCFGELSSRTAGLVGSHGQERGKPVTEMADDEVHVPLQAVLLADSFTQKFRPITLEKPKVLLPLVNVPLIDYTLEWLASAGVEECFVFCCAHANQVRNHLTKAKWKSQPNFAVTPIESYDCVSAGDALRLIEQRGVEKFNNSTVCQNTLLKLHQLNLLVYVIQIYQSHTTLNSVGQILLRTINFHNRKFFD